MRSVYIPSPKCGSNAIKQVLTEHYDMLNFHEAAQGDPLHYSAAPEKDHTINTEGFTSWATNNSVSSLFYYKPPVWLQQRVQVSDEPAYAELACHRDNWNTPGEMWAKDFFTSKFYSWTVTRNPWERMASAWSYLTEIGSTKSDFNDFIEVICGYDLIKNILFCGCTGDEHYNRSPLGRLIKINAMGKLDRLTKCIGPDGNGNECVTEGSPDAARRLWPFPYSIHDCNTNVLRHTQRWQGSQLFSGNIVIDLGRNFLGESPRQPRSITKVVHFDRLQEGFDEVMDDLGLKKYKLPHTHKGTLKQNEYQKMYTSKNRDLVHSWHAYEIAKFGYKFGK